MTVMELNKNKFKISEILWFQLFVKYKMSVQCRLQLNSLKRNECVQYTKREIHTQYTKMAMAHQFTKENGIHSHEYIYNIERFFALLSQEKSVSRNNIDTTHEIGFIYFITSHNY